MKLDPKKLPICQEVLTGRAYYNKEGDRIEEGDVIQIIAPKSKYHKFVCLFIEFDRSLWVKYNTGQNEYPITVESIHPGGEWLTWEDFKINVEDDWI